jgi:hypothetical protein
MSREPLFSSASIVAFATALLSCLVSFGLDITNDQQSKLLALIGIVASFAVAFLARPQVTPVKDPRDNLGQPLTPVTETRFRPDTDGF